MITKSILTNGLCLKKLVKFTVQVMCLFWITII